MRFGFIALVAFLVASCSTYREDLNRGQRHYEENEYDQALAIWRILEEDRDSLSLSDQARYAYLRGMTDYRLGFRPDARHWLAIAKAIEQEHPGGLDPQWQKRLNQSLNELNREVYGIAKDPKPATDDQASSKEETKMPDIAPPSDDECGSCPGDHVCQAGQCVKS